MHALRLLNDVGSNVAHGCATVVCARLGAYSQLLLLLLLVCTGMLGCAGRTGGRWCKWASQAAGTRASGHSRQASQAAGAGGGGGFCLDLTEEQRALQGLARKFATEVMAPRAAAHDKSGTWPTDIFKAAWELGLVNMHIPKRYGGLGLGGLEGVITAEELAWADAGMMTAMEINSVAEIPVMLAGTEEQKREYLGRMVAAPIQAAYAVTEPGM